MYEVLCLFTIKSSGERKWRNKSWSKKWGLMSEWWGEKGGKGGGGCEKGQEGFESFFYYMMFNTS